MLVKTSFSSKWLRLALLNFGVAALAGVFLRYKVSYAFPAVDFKNLLHAHSHFAFAGWVSTALFALLMAFFLSEEQQNKKIYRTLFVLSQLSSYGMLISFLLQEYGTYSIAFSTFNIFVSYGFAWMLWRDTRHYRKSLSVFALRTSLVCLVLSSLGPFALAGMIASKYMNGEVFHNAVYWYLHFQYNGWFSFAIFAVALQALAQKFHPSYPTGLKTALWLMIISCLPSYLLSILWIVPPLWVYIVAGMSAFLQIIGYIFLVRFIRKEKAVLKFSFKSMGAALLAMAFISFTIKVFLQQLLVFPYLNERVFGHRPVIIGYLHLVMLGLVSFFIIGMAIRENIYSTTKRIASASLLVFVLGVLLNELALLVRGLDDIFYVQIPILSLALFIAALMLFGGISVFAVSQQVRKQ